MKIDTTNINRIHELLITDIQRRLFKQYNARKDEFKLTDEDYDVTQTLLVDKVLHCNSIKDINDLLLSYIDLFDGEKIYNHVFTLDGTMNYVFSLLIEHCKLMSEPV